MSSDHVDVLIVGAGLSGIGAGHYIQAECPWASYAIFEARDAIGGTWDLFRYPGIRSDSDMFTLGYRFRPWPSDQAIADGGSILRYIPDVAADEGIDRHIRFNHRIVRADWSSADALSGVTAVRSDTGDTVELTCGFVFSCTGYYRYDSGHRPDFAGMERFPGPIVHPQEWPDDLEYAGKRVVVIGSGATAITLIPSPGCHGEARDHAPTLSELHRVAAGPNRALPVSSPGAAPVSCRRRRPLVQRPRHAGVLSPQSPSPGFGEKGAPQGRPTAVAARL